MSLLVLAAPAPLPHDASTGFHDIKPLPEFSPFPYDVLLFCLAATLLVLIGYWLFKKQRQVEPDLAPVVSPYIAALEQLEHIEQQRKAGTIALRDLGTGVSLTLRKYLSATLHFPADDQTNREVLRHLRIELPGFFKSATDQEVEKTLQQVESALDALERITYSGDITAKVTPGEAWVEELVISAKQVTQQLNRWQEEDEARLRSEVRDET